MLSNLGRAFGALSDRSDTVEVLHSQTNSESYSLLVATRTLSLDSDESFAGEQLSICNGITAVLMKGSVQGHLSTAKAICRLFPASLRWLAHAKTREVALLCCSNAV